ncbi:ABC transporter substrate-binding protein [Streptomyces sp. NPDC003011]
MSDPLIGRRALLRGAGGLAALAALPSLAACGTGTTRAATAGGQAGSKTVIVRDSGGSFGEALQKAVYTPFTQETGIAVKVTSLEGTQMLAQMKQGRPQFDLVNTSMMDLFKFADQGHLENLDRDRIKSLKSAKIPDGQITEHAVAHSFYAQCMAYRTDDFGGRKPESWADFWDTKSFKGSRSLCNPDADLAELEFALLADGVPLDKLYPLDVDRAFKVMDRIRSDVKKFWDSGPLPGVLLSREEVTMSTIWHGRLADLTKQGVPVAAQLDGARRQFSGFGIPMGAAHVDTAYQLLDYSLHPEVQARLAKTFPANPSSPVAYKKLTEKELSTLAGAPEYYDKGFDADIEWWIKNEAAVIKRWLEWARG